MKEYSVYLKKPITVQRIQQVLNKQTQLWEEKEINEEEQYFHFYSLTEAKKFIKNNLDNYASSCITKIYSNGDWENCGEIKLKGSNAIQMSNMTTKQY